MSSVWYTARHATSTQGLQSTNTQKEPRINRRLWHKCHRWTHLPHSGSKRIKGSKARYLSGQDKTSQFSGATPFVKLQNDAWTTAQRANTMKPEVKQLHDSSHSCFGFLPPSTCEKLECWPRSRPSMLRWGAKWTMWGEEEKSHLHAEECQNLDGKSATKTWTKNHHRVSCFLVIFVSVFVWFWPFYLWNVMRRVYLNTDWKYNE